MFIHAHVTVIDHDVLDDFCSSPGPVHTHVIIRWGKLVVVKYLIEVQGCSTECTDNSGQTPLYLACGENLSVTKFIHL